MTRLADVWRTKTWHWPMRRPARDTMARSRAVMSVNPLPGVSTITSSCNQRGDDMGCSLVKTGEARVDGGLRRDVESFCYDEPTGLVTGQHRMQRESLSTTLSTQPGLPETES